MNNDEKNPEMKKLISAELEARMLAWVAGGASEQESAELALLTAGSPELAALKARIEAAQKLVAQAVHPDKEPLRLSKERRAALLEALGAPESAGAQAALQATAFPTLEVTRRKQRNERRWLLATAACLTAGLFLSVVIRPSHVFKASDRSVTTESFVLAGKKNEAVANAELHKEEEAREPSLVAAMPAIPAPEEPDANAPAAVLSNAASLAPASSSYYRAGLEHMDMKSAPDSTAAKQSLSRAKSDFLADAGATSTKDMLNFTQNAEIAGQNGNFQNTAANSRTFGVAGDSTLVPEVARQSAIQNGSSDRSEKRTLFGVGSLGGIQDSKVADAESLTASNENNSAAAPTTTTTGAPAAESAEETVALSPFVVTAPEEKGSYKANSTLAGTRVRTDLADTQSAVAAVTGRFQQDTEATGFEETSAAKEPLSTFSLHVSDVSFRLAQAALARGEAPDPESIRPEEFYNAFSYGDPAPAMSEEISCRIEQSADPVEQQRNLVRIAMTVPSTGRGEAQALRLTVLLDTSGSMERGDRAAAVRKAMAVLVSLLGPGDRITLIGFARQPRLLAEQVPGDKAGRLLEIIAHTPSEGGTNMEEAIKLAGELALRQFAPGAQNRIVLLTDGAANLGDADPAHLAARVEALRQEGLSFDACGVGTGGIDDSVLESLTRKGSGRYYVLNTPEAADAGFARQLAGAFRPAAENVKVQVRFNPARVGSYRLIGFEHHRLEKEDFRNDKVGAAALASGESAVALYEVEVLPQGEGELGEVRVRFRDTAANSMVERSWTLAYEPRVAPFDRATPTMQLAGTAALLAEKLRGGARADAIKLDPLAPVVNALRGHFAHEARVQELATMYEQMRRMGGE